MATDHAQAIIRSLTAHIRDERAKGDPNGLVKGLILARAVARSYVPQTAREVDELLVRETNNAPQA